MNDLYDHDVYDNQIVAMYSTRQKADQAVEALRTAGIPASDISVHDQSTTGSANDEGFWASLKNMFAPEEDYRSLGDGIGRGYSVLLVTPSSDIDRKRVAEVLEKSDAMDFDDHVAGTATPAAATTTAAAPVMAATMPAATTAPVSAAKPAGTGLDDTIKVVQERLRVGKREVDNGSVRVRSYVVERPVEEQVRLREQRVSLERRPVDRPVTDADTNLFQERTLEARSTAEQAVVQKEARVVEEIGLKRETNERVETVRDKVRETKVEVDDSGLKKPVAPTATTTSRP